MIPMLLMLASLAAASEDVDSPSLELLEFLGSFETEDGEWLDPLSLDTMIPDIKDGPDNQDDDEKTDTDSEHLPGPDDGQRRPGG